MLTHRGLLFHLSPSGEALARDNPRLCFKVAGGFFVNRAWTLELVGATHAFAHAVRHAGATIRTGLRVAQICTRGGKVEGVLTDQGIFRADMVYDSCAAAVCATSTGSIPDGTRSTRPLPSTTSSPAADLRTGAGRCGSILTGNSLAGSW